MKAQLRQADRSGATVALIVGAEELERGVITIKLLRGSLAHHQEQTPRDGLIGRVRELLA